MTQCVYTVIPSVPRLRRITRLEEEIILAKALEHVATKARRKANDLQFPTLTRMRSVSRVIDEEAYDEAVISDDTLAQTRINPSELRRYLLCQSYRGLG